MASQAEQPDDVRTRLARFIHDLEYKDIPDELLQLEKQHVMDTLGCIIYGSTTNWVGNFFSSFQELEAGGRATIVGKQTSLTPATAVLLNGTASHSMDYDDYCLDGGIHAGASTIPPALALAETHDDITGEEFLTAVTAGVETGIRVGTGIGREVGKKGFHIGGWTGPPAAAATTGKLLGLDREEMAHAIAMGLTLGAGFLGAAKGANIKRFHMGRAAESGFLAAHFAKHSVQGDPGIFKKQWGSLYALAGETFTPEAITENIENEFAIPETLSFKPFPSVGTIHPSVTALRRVLEKHDINASEVAEVNVHVTKQVKDKVGWEYVPVDVMSAQGSLKYALAAYLEDEQLNIDDYTEEAIRRQSVIDRTDHINVLVDNSLKEADYDFLADTPYKRSRRLRLEVVTKSGKTYERLGEVPKGWPANRMTMSETRQKFRNLSSGVLSEAEMTELEDLVLEIDELDNVDRIVSLLE